MFDECLWDKEGLMKLDVREVDGCGVVIKLWFEFDSWLVIMD